MRNKKSIVEGAIAGKKKTEQVCIRPVNGDSLETLSLDYDTSEKLAGLIDALPNQCWLNAIKALSHLPGGWYIEGWLVIEGIPLEHGWCEWEGRIVDPTLYNQLEGWRTFYLPGVKYSPDEVFIRCLKKSATVPFVWHGKRAGIGGLGNKSYRDAYYLAMGLY